MHRSPKVYIIIVNYNGWQDTIECLESIFKSQYQYYQIVVVDNNSENQSISFLKRWAKGELSSWVPCSNTLRVHSFPQVMKPLDYVVIDQEEIQKVQLRKGNGTPEKSLIFIESSENLGFAGGNNLGIRYALSQGDCDFVWLLNNDTIIKNDSLHILIDHSNKNPDAACFGSKILYYDEPKLIQSVGSRMDYSSIFKLSKPIINTARKNFDKGQFKEAFEVSDIMGASLIIRAEALLKYGLIPEEYFLYCEETDWNYNIQLKGHKILTVPHCEVYHKESRSTGGSQGHILLYYKTRNQFLLYKKYRGKFISNSLLYFTIYCIRKVIYALTLNAKSRKAIFAGLKDGMMGRSGRKPKV